jgi:hypothetical protein
LCEAKCPLSNHIWSSIEKDFNKWAIDQGRPQRDFNGLKLKFERLANGPSTGHGGPSSNQLRAKKIQQEIMDRLCGCSKNPESCGESDVSDVEMEADAIATERTRKRGRQSLDRLLASTESPNPEPGPVNTIAQQMPKRRRSGLDASITEAIQLMARNQDELLRQNERRRELAEERRHESASESRQFKLALVNLLKSISDGLSGSNHPTND